LDKWEVSAVEDFSGLFKDITTCKQKLDGIADWNTREVTDMSYMFYNAIEFNQDIGLWNTDNVEDRWCKKQPKVTSEDVSLLHKVAVQKRLYEHDPCMTYKIRFR
jgi:surface protein